MSVLQPSAALLCQLASIAVHAEELLSDDGHALDRDALLSSLRNPDVVAWLEAMTAAALAPVKRSRP